MIARDPETGKLSFSIPDDHLYFDIWRNHRWIGMSTGVDIADALKTAQASFGSQVTDLILTPYNGAGTSQATYKAVTGHDCIS